MRENDQGKPAEPQRPGQGEPTSPAPSEAAPLPPAGRRPEDTGTEALARALKASFAVLRIAMVVLAVVYVLSGFFSVESNQVSFKLRFGEVVPVGGKMALRSGRWYFRLPVWEQVETVSTDEKALDLTKEFWTEWPMDPSQGKRTLSVRQDGYAISGDANIVHMRLRLRYRVSDAPADALAYRFAIEDPEGILKRALMTSAVKVVGSMPVMDVIKRQGLVERITDELTRRVAQFESQAGVPLGVTVTSVEAIQTEKVKNPTEPFVVSQAFAEAQNAGSLRGRLVEEGRLQSNTIVTGAEAKAREIEARARGDAVRLVEATKADAAALTELLPMYERSPQEARILRERFTQRALQSVFNGARGVFVLHEVPSGELRFMLGRRPPVSPKRKQ